MAMSRKHYRKTADILAAELATARTDDERRIVRNITLSMADMFRQDNPNFDRGKFYTATGIIGTVGPFPSGPGDRYNSAGDLVDAHGRAGLPVVSRRS